MLAIVKFWPAFKGSITRCAYLSVLWESCWVLRAWPNRDHWTAQEESLFQLFGFLKILFYIFACSPQSWQMHPFTGFLVFWPRHSSYRGRGEKEIIVTLAKCKSSCFVWSFMDILVIWKEKYLVFYNFVAVSIVPRFQVLRFFWNWWTEWLE